MALIEQNKPDAFSNIREIWRSPLIPSDPIVWRKDLPEETKTKLRDFFLAYGTANSKGDIAHEKEVLAGLKWAPFKASTDKQLLPIRVMEMSKSIAQTESDTKLSADEKTAKLKDLQAKKVAYETKLASMPQG